jgi:cytoplasmic iron level regulating protein YaaA (DUF328/UPF0246 family)
LLIFSGLWGALRITDRIPSYRCPVGARLPGIGALAAFWRGPMAAAGALPRAAAEAGGLVLDLRSAAYAGMWRPAGEPARRTVTVRVLTETNGRLTVVSHFNKAVKGRIVRDLLLRPGAPPRTPRALADALRELGYAADEPVDGRLDVVVENVTGTGTGTGNVMGAR